MDDTHFRQLGTSPSSARTRALRLAQIRDVDVDRLGRAGIVRVKVDDDALIGRCRTEGSDFGTAPGKQ
jgi:hypothetical protein